VLAAAAPHNTHTPPAKHVPGCNTRACDSRIGRWLARWRQAHAPPVQMAEGVASWYDDSEPVACTRPEDGYGVASLQVPCGTRVRVCSSGCVTATVDDHGPYVTGRIFDLGPKVKAAIRCPDLCGLEGSTFRWAIVTAA
jgi:rare lipoprotein A (peptidoglycan hydrolase)